jgi:multicomponent Na+:H+ antiporter subunit E
MRRLALYAVLLTVSWVLLWDRLSAANVAAGAAVAAALMAAFRLRPVAPENRLSLRPIGLARLAGSIVRSLVLSNLLLSREIASRSTRLRTGIIACPMHTSSPKLLATMANILALSPGMMAVDATNDPPMLYVHLFTLEDMDVARRKVAHLEELVIGAIGSPAARAALRAAP